MTKFSWLTLKPPLYNALLVNFFSSFSWAFIQIQTCLKIYQWKIIFVTGSTMILKIEIFSLQRQFLLKTCCAIFSFSLFYWTLNVRIKRRNVKISLSWYSKFDKIAREDRTADFKGSLQRKDLNLQDHGRCNNENKFLTVSRVVWNFTIFDDESIHLWKKQTEIRERERKKKKKKRTYDCQK